MKIKSRIFLALLLTLCVKTAFSQVSIAPIFVFMDDRNRFGSFVVLNGSNQNQEVSVDFIFGYSATDTDGNSFMIYNDTVAYNRYAATDWVRAFPRTFVLAPGQRQTVRINARPPQNMADGIYWTRIRTASNPQVPSIEDLAVEGVRTQITFRFEQVTALFYKKGNLSTGLELTTLRGEKQGNEFAAFVNIKRTGNSPFFGSVNLVLRDANNRVVAESSQPVSIYFDGVRRFMIPVENTLSNGRYTLQATFESQRNDMASQDIVQTTPVSSSAAVEIR